MISPARLSRRLLSSLILCAPFAAALLPHAAQAQDSYPDKPVRFVTNFPARGPLDILGRALAIPLQAELKQPFVLDNRPGAGGNIGADLAAKSPADGYTVLLTIDTTFTINPHVYKTMPFAAKDLKPLMIFSSSCLAFGVNPAVPAKNLAEFIALLKANPGKYAYASSGAGGIGHLDGELFKSLTKTDMVHVPYRGSGPALNDVIAGQVNAQFDNLPSSMPHIQAGKLRALAVAAPKRLPALPDVPTFTEGGLPEMDNMAWYGLVAPAGTPQAVVDRIHDATVKALKDPKIAQRLADGGSLVDGNTPAEYAAQIKRELELRQRIAKERNIQSTN